jgi:N-acetylglutamate synthase-like GNAT family acetyltransferase
MSLSPPVPFSEREFYLREFRGRTLAIAVPAGERAAFTRIRPVLDDLEVGGSQVLLLSPHAAALDEHVTARVISAQQPRLEGEVWRRFREQPRLGIVVSSGDRFVATCRRLAVELGVFKLVWIDRRGGLRGATGNRHSFLHLDELQSLLEGKGSGLANTDRLEFWREVATMLEAGLPAVNVCCASGLAEELFTYAGSGTLFTRDRYMSVRRLGIDDFDAAHDLIHRGVEEGYLVARTGEEVDAILASAFGAFVEGRHLAGIGALLPGGEERSGEIASLYTLTRFLGEGVGGSLVGFACSRARELGLSYVYACTTSDRVGAFFERNGFREVAREGIPEAKWRRYDPERRCRVRCYRRELSRSSHEVA